ncbi:MAG: hypothetical protein ACLQDM_02170 [Bradyrhizobium sp.]
MKSARLITASALYFAMVFAAGFLLGAIRVFALEPRWGKFIGVLCESPFLLAAMILAARFVSAKTRLAGDYRSLAVVGLGALVLQQLTDFAVGTLLRGLTAAEQLRNFTTPAGGIYAILLLLFAAMPLLVNGRWGRIAP